MAEWGSCADREHRPDVVSGHSVTVRDQPGIHPATGGRGFDGHPERRGSIARRRFVEGGVG